MKMNLKLSLVLAALGAVACAEAPVRSNLGSHPLPPSAFDAELTNYSYPRDVKFFEFQSQNQPLRMAYELAEPKDPNGRTVLLLHGKNFTAAYWEETIQALLEKGFRVLAPDQIGFGKSSKPAAYQFSFQALSANTHALLKYLAIEKVSLVGHSMGGMLATRFALQYPERVEKLVLVNPIGLEDWQRSVPYRGVEENYQAELKATPASLREYQRVNYFDGKWKEAYASLVEVASGFTRHPDYPRVAWNNALTADMIFTQPVLYDFPRLNLPTLLIIGQRDRTAIGKAWADPAAAKLLGNYPALGRAAAQAIKKSQLVELPGLGHLPQVEDFPKFRSALLKFL